MTDPQDDTMPTAPAAELVPLDDLRPHPRNYRAHPEDQLAHIVASIREHGFYRNVVATRDGTVLAGHGVVAASRQLGLPSVPTIRLDVEPDDPRALRVLTGDNAIANLADDDDRMLTELLRELHDDDVDGLLGTGFDDQMLAALAMTTRPKAEIEDGDAAAEWLGMPTFDPGADEIRLVVRFRSSNDLKNFLTKKLGGQQPHKREGGLSVWWPDEGKADLSSVVFTDDPAESELLT